MPRNYVKVARKEGYILGIKVSITSKKEVLDFVSSRLDEKEKFYIVTPNPENLLMATKDWLLAKAIRRSDLSIPDGIGLSQAYTFLNYRDSRLDEKHNNFEEYFLRPIRIFSQGLFVGLMTIVNKDYLTKNLKIIKGREIFLDIMKIANDRSLKVYLFGGQNGESEGAKKVLENDYKNVTFKTYHKFPTFNKNGQPVSEVDRKLHKVILGSIKLFEPDLVIVALNTPKQEKWIYRNFFRLTKVTGAMAFGGTFNYVAGNMKLPPKWMDKVGLEWLYRLIQEPKRIKRIINATVVFPWTTFVYKIKRHAEREKRKLRK